MGTKYRWLDISSYKHDGSIHRKWDRGFVVEETDDYIAVACKRAKVVENNGRCWYTHEPAVTIFSKNDWWNVICMFKPDGVCYYCNIASPSVVTETSIVYIDYDLDAKLFANKYITVLDKKEYIKHSKKYNYSEDLDKVLRFTTDQIVRTMKQNVFPFDDEKIENLYHVFEKRVMKKNEI